MGFLYDLASSPPPPIGWLSIYSSIGLRLGPAASNPELYGWLVVVHTSRIDNQPIDCGGEEAGSCRKYIQKEDATSLEPAGNPGVGS